MARQETVKCLCCDKTLGTYPSNRIVDGLNSVIEKSGAMLATLSDGCFGFVCSECSVRSEDVLRYKFNIVTIHRDQESNP